MARRYRGARTAAFLSWFQADASRKAQGWQRRSHHFCRENQAIVILRVPGTSVACIGRIPEEAKSCGQ
jgi:hypothetical protein